MNALEERLRDGLSVLAEPVQPATELERVLAGGERLRRRRRVGWTSGAVLASAVLVAVPIAGLMPWQTSGDRVMATPAETVAAPSETPSAPTPTAKLTTSQNTVDAPGRARFELAGRVDLPNYGLRAVDVRGAAKDAGYALVVTAVSKAGDHQETVVRLAPGRQEVVRVASQAWLLLTAGDPLWVHGTAEGGGILVATTKVVGGLPVFAALVESEAEEVDVAGLLWQDASGVVRDQDGGEVPAARFRLDGRYFVFVRDATGTLACGAEWTGGMGRSAVCSDLAEQAPGRIVVAGGGGGSEKRGYESVSYVVLPAGSREGIEVEARDATCQVADSRIGGIGESMYLVLCRLGSRDASGVAEIRYRDAAGQLVRYHP